MHAIAILRSVSDFSKTTAIKCTLNFFSLTYLSIFIVLKLLTHTLIKKGEIPPDL